MALEIESKSPIFLVLPSLIVQNYYNRSEYSLLDPVMGSYNNVYTAKKHEYSDMEGHKSKFMKIDGKLYICTDADKLLILRQQGVKNSTPFDIGGYTINSSIEWPHHYFKDRDEIAMVGDKGEFVKYKAILPDYFIISDGTIKKCEEGSIIEIDSKSYLNDVFRVCYYDNQHNSTIKSLRDGECSKILFKQSKKNICYTDEETDKYVGYALITNVQTGKTVKCAFDPDGIKEIYENLISITGDDPTTDIYLLSDDINLKQKMSVKDLGNMIARIKSENPFKIYRVMENPFETVEKNKLANWLYEQINQLIPQTIINIITDYCVLVKYYDYDILMNYIKAQLLVDNDES
jgi:hypothetical protein